MAYPQKHKLVPLKTNNEETKTTLLHYAYYFKVALATNQ